MELITKGPATFFKVEDNKIVVGKFEDGEGGYVRPYGESGVSVDIKSGWDVKKDNKAWRAFLNGFAKDPTGVVTKINPNISLRSALLQVRKAAEEAKKVFLNYENYTLGLIWKEPVKKFSSLKQYRRWKNAKNRI